MKKKFVSKLSKKVSAGVAIVALSIGCATGSKGVYGPIDNAVLKGEYPKAVSDIQADSENKTPKIYPKLNDVLYNLDKGTLEHYASQYQDSFANLEAAEQLISEYQSASVTQAAASLLTNDNAKTYAGEAYEDVYDSVFNALNNYHLGNIQNAQVEARQINEKLAALQTKADASAKQVQDYGGQTIKGFELPEAVQGKKDEPPAKFSNSALGNYLSMVLLRGKSESSAAQKQIALAYTAAPNVYTNPVPASIADELNVPEGKARLNVLAFTGLSPIKQAQTVDIPLVGLSYLTLYITNIAMALPNAKGFDAATISANLALTMAPMQMRLSYPVMGTPRSAGANDITVEIEGQDPVKLELLEDMGKVITETFNVGLPAVKSKTFIRSLIKTGGAVAGLTVAQVAADKESDFKKKLALKSAVTAATVIVNEALKASEAADTRMARYLPNKAFVGGITLDPGTYKVKVKVGGQIVFDKSVEVQADQPNIVEAVSLK